MGPILALSATLIGGLAVIQLTLVASRAAHAEILTSVVIATVAVSVTASLWPFTPPAARASLTEFRRFLPSLGALAGPGVWYSSLLFGTLSSGFVRVSWALRGDSANNLLIARELLASGGIGIGPTENPAPLAPAVLAIGLAAARRGASDPTLQVDVGGFALTWALVIALACFVAGIVAVSFVSSQRPVVAVLVAAAGSLVPLSWFVSGYQIEFGFFSANIVIVVALLCLLTFVRAKRSPAIALSILLLAGTVMLGCWGPLAVVPAAFAVVVSARQWRTIVRAKGLQRALLLIAFTQLLAYGIVVALPPTLQSKGALTSAGAIYNFAPFVCVVVLVFAICLAAIRALRAKDDVLIGVIVLIISLAIGVAALLFLNRHATTLWSYYPVKLLWLTSAIVLIVCVGLLGAVLAEYVISTVSLVAACVIAAGATWLFLGATQTVSTYPARSAVEHAFRDDSPFIDDLRFAQLARLADRPFPNIYWRSGLPGEKYLNFWLLQIHAGLSQQNFPIRVAAYGLGATDIKSLCTLGGVLGPGTEVHTRDSELEAEAQRSCPSVDLRFVSVDGE